MCQISQCEDDFTFRRVRLAVYNYLREVPIYNAFAMIRGEIEEGKTPKMSTGSLI